MKFLCFLMLSSLLSVLLGSCRNGEQRVICETVEEKADTFRNVLFFTNDSCMKMRICSNYGKIDSIIDSDISFDATYHSCGKGGFGFSKKDLNHIKNADLREKIAYYYSEWDFDENNMPAEPTAVLLAQRGEKFYLNTLESVDNACSLPQNTPVTCKAYCLEVFTKEGVFSDVVIYDLRMCQKTNNSIMDNVENQK